MLDKNEKFCRAAIERQNFTFSSTAPYVRNVKGLHIFRSSDAVSFRIYDNMKI
jgi:hypothetical protein